MAEQMTELQLMMQERMNTGTAWTHNESFEKNGYLVIKNLWDSEELYHPLPEERGQMNWWGKNMDQFNHQPIEMQVEGSLARYWHPQYRQIHTGIRLKLEKELGRKLYNTYYYDRYYFPGQELTRHADRDACEISVTVHVSTNLTGEDADWPIWIKTPDTYVDKKKTQVLVTGENHSVVLKPGDGMVYKGCERPHWRNPMPKGKANWFSKKQFYYHQIFFHYVLSDGIRCQCYMDRSS
jgi:hypothetical protein